MEGGVPIIWLTIGGDLSMAWCYKLRLETETLYDLFGKVHRGVASLLDISS